MLQIGEVIGEFLPVTDAKGVRMDAYTNELKRMMLVMGRIPGKGGWKIMVMNDSGFTNEIPEKDIQKHDGKYIIGGLAVVMHAAGMPEEDIQRAPIPEELKDCAPIPEELKEVEA